LCELLYTPRLEGFAMDRDSLDRRQFSQLVGAAFGGLVAGSTLGCGGEDKGGGSAAGGSAAAGQATAADPATKVVHACRGLNECKGQGTDGKNACAGQGICATAKHHTCGGQNECKNLGGCGQLAGANACKGQGGCAVPLEHAWDTARKHFEKRMKDAGKTFGDAPPAAKKE
jgi:hypothetical protein